jgi:hypothetical protein
MFGLSLISAGVGVVVALTVKPHAALTGRVVQCQEIRDSKKVRSDRLAMIRTDVGNEVRRILPEECCPAQVEPVRIERRAWRSDLRCGTRMYRDTGVSVFLSIAGVAGMFLALGIVTMIKQRAGRASRLALDR